MIELSEKSKSYEKAFYVYSNNSFREMAKGDLENLIPNVSMRVREKVNLGLHYLSQDHELMAMIQELKSICDTENIPQ